MNLTVKINLGSGPVLGRDGWLNIDIAEGADLRVDLSLGLPFSSGSIARIYSSHFFEHLYYPDIRRLLAECWRVLSPGGDISICVPDARKFIEAYLSRDYELVTLESGQSISVPRFLLSPAEAIYRQALVQTGSAIDWLNYIAYSNSEHKYMFDSENIVAHLGMAGFGQAVLRDFDPLLDHDYGRQASIYARAIK
jgi:SAM-dependent methyltransferase